MIDLPLYILEDSVLFPGVFLPLRLHTFEHFQTLENSLSEKNRLIFAGLKKPHGQKLDVEDVGCVGRVALVEKKSHKGKTVLEILVEGLYVSKLQGWNFANNSYVARINGIEEDELDHELFLEQYSLLSKVLDSFYHSSLPIESYITRLRKEGLSDDVVSLFILTFLCKNTNSKQNIIESRNPNNRLRIITDSLADLFLKNSENKIDLLQ